jgi:hypothetical protein
VRWDSGKEEDCVFTGDGGDFQLVLCNDGANQSLNMSRASSTDSKDYTLDQTSLNVGEPPPMHFHLDFPPHMRPAPSLDAGGQHESTGSLFPLMSSVACHGLSRTHGPKRPMSA